MHRQLIGVVRPAEGLELPAQPVAEEGEDTARLRPGGMVELRQLVAQRAHRTAETHDLGAVDGQDVDEASDPLGRVAPLRLPLVEQRAPRRQPSVDHGRQDLVLRLEIVVEVPARDADGGGDVGEGGRIVAAFVEQPVRHLDDRVARLRSGHLPPSPDSAAIGNLDNCPKFNRTNVQGRQAVNDGS
jgi:hypothetical protein